jgi:type III secretion system YscC/HrcC family outer membrane pore protein
MHMPNANLKAFTLATSLLCGAAHATHALGAQPGWNGNRFVYATNGSSIADALNVFAAGQHVPVRLSGNVEGVVSGRFAMPPERFLDTLTASFGLVWYYDGAVVQVSRASEKRSIAIRPHYMPAGALFSSLTHAGVVDTHFPLRLDSRAGTVAVTGPPGYVERIRAAGQRFEDDTRARTRTTVRIVRLGVAVAADRTRTIGDREVVVPGAATLLRKRLTRARADSRAAQASAPEALSGVELVEYDAPLPVFEADARTNSILIRDRPEHIDGDAMLVADIDRKPDLISIETYVFDVDRDALAALEAEPAYGAGTGPEARDGRFTLAAEDGRALLASLTRLRQAKRARMDVARTALTMDRSPTVIDRHEARLAQRDGETDAPLTDLWLSIVPTVTGDAPSALIDLSVDLGARGPAAKVESATAGTSGVEGGSHDVMVRGIEPGQCVVIAAPAAQGQEGDGDARRRVVLMIPRFAG